MSDLKVYDTTVPGVLESLKKGEWLVPQFQRDFVWSTDQVSALVQSILEARPIGMVTLWEQEDNGRLQIERISITDRTFEARQSTPVYFGPDVLAAKRFVLLDGRQRCTAIAMAFGGFRASSGLYRYSGRYYLDVKQVDPRKRVKYLRESEVKKSGLDRDATCVGQGLFPLASNIAEENVLSQWMRYLQAIERADNYVDANRPSDEELQRRNQILRDAFEGIVKTKLAVYVVPEKYTLAEICDIFETLNTTGTKVSTVDLIHSWLYSDTSADPSGPFLLRDWISDFGQKDGAIGWSTKDDRPELITQIVTACHVALIDKPAPRAVGAGRAEPITSVKSGDLLAIPAEHWQAIKKNQHELALSLGKAQKVVAGGYFPWSSSPYPVSISIYVALRWHKLFDKPELHPWDESELDAIFRAFFWRNALARRYDQGFLSQVGTDIGSLKAILANRPTFSSSSAWAESAEKQLAPIFEYPVPEKKELVELLTNGPQSGAMAKALALPMLAQARLDPVQSSIDLAYPSVSPIELHHIYPKEWCRNNRTSELSAILDPAVAGRDYVGSIANQMPLSRPSNNAWRQKFPAQYLSESNIRFAPNQENFKALFIDELGFGYLSGGAEDVEKFWLHRAEMIADALLQKTRVIL